MRSDEADQLCTSWRCATGRANARDRDRSPRRLQRNNYQNTSEMYERTSRVGSVSIGRERSVTTTPRRGFRVQVLGGPVAHPALIQIAALPGWDRSAQRTRGRPTLMITSESPALRLIDDIDAAGPMTSDFAVADQRGGAADCPVVTALLC